MKVWLGWKIGATAGLVCSLSALFWLVSWTARPTDFLSRLGWVSAGLCAEGAFVFLSAACFAHVARQRNWSAKRCHLSGFLIVVPGTLFLAGPHANFYLWWSFVCGLPPITGYICRKLAYPEMTDEEAFAPEAPLSLFPK